VVIHKELVELIINKFHTGICSEFMYLDRQAWDNLFLMHWLLSASFLEVLNIDIGSING
jgi:hypothetical protein